MARKGARAFVKEVKRKDKRGKHQENVEKKNPILGNTLLTFQSIVIVGQIRQGMGSTPVRGKEGRTRPKDVRRQRRRTKIHGAAQRRIERLFAQNFARRRKCHDCRIDVKK